MSSKARRTDTPYMIVKLLNSLKGFYTFKELEEKVGIPSQILWRYTSLTHIPEKGTSWKIVKKVLEHGLARRAIDRVITRNSYGYIETWKYLYDFLGIVGYEAARFVGPEDIDVVVAFPEEDAPLALAVSEWLGSRTCVGFTRAGLHLGGFLQSSYVSPDRGMMVNVYMPKGVIRKGDNVLIVKNIAKDWASLEVLMHIMETVKARVWGHS